MSQSVDIAIVGRTLHSLPEDILLSLPVYLHDIEDFVNLGSTCCLFYSLSVCTSPRTILHLAAAASRTFFRPSPHFLVAATARQLSEWASLSPANITHLRDAFRGGTQAVLDLALEHAGLTMARIRELYEMRFATINPVVDLIDKCVGMQWYSTPNFWDGGVDDAYTIDADPPETFFHLVTYGELFGSAIETFLETGVVPEVASVEMRLEYIKYCLPEWKCWISMSDLKRRYGTIDPRRVVMPVGPYVPFGRYEEIWVSPPDFSEHGNQEGLLHLLESTRWNPSWKEVRAAVGGDFDVEWKQEVWRTVVMCQGLHGMEMIRPGNIRPWRERLTAWRAKIEALTTRPDRVRIHNQETYIFPNIQGDLHVLIGR
ncbi:hypothetical protein FOMPIDRAFT_1164125 [Fomitopsis schrenkii]|uniref:Uncharacterized protein n=1 Tax=Fomitopsis schrenkii TaxID=2126942 RepID=S8FLR4_FOMSC|nr:hypothetical protein FOMPIDRAFT_1164125 [Fomitopsis schrenkii]